MNMHDLRFLEPKNADERKYIDAVRCNPEPFPEKCMPGVVGELVHAFANLAPQYPLAWVHLCVMDQVDQQIGLSKHFDGKSFRDEVVQFGIGK
jgi:hypothetical protein